MDIIVPYTDMIRIGAKTDPTDPARPRCCSPSCRNYLGSDTEGGIAGWWGGEHGIASYNHNIDTSQHATRRLQGRHLSMAASVGLPWSKEGYI